MSSFSIKELLDCFRNAKEKNPANVNSRINDNIKKGFIMTSDDKEGSLKRFELTNKGVKYVEANMREES